MKKWASSVIAVLGAAAIVLCGIGTAEPAQARPETPGQPGQGSVHGSGQPDHDSGGSLMHFRLSDAPGSRFAPDAFNYANRTSTVGPLLLFLPATRAVPASYRSFLDTASGLGYHVLGLDYWNKGRSVTRTCGMNADCYTTLQRNRFNGSVPSQFSRVDRTNSVVGRLGAALRYLHAQDADGGWNRYYHGSHIRWNRIVVAGHSQGGGESAYIAHRTRVQGALMFSSPVETENGVAASWMGTPGKTSPSRMYAFDNINDMYFTKIVGSWKELGLGRFGKPVRGLTPTGSHQLIGTNSIGNPAQSHGRTVADTTPRSTEGVPGYQPVWTWMLTQVRHQTPPAQVVDRRHSGI